VKKKITCKNNRRNFAINISQGDMMVVKVGSDERPAGKKDVEDVKKLLKLCWDNPNLSAVMHHVVSVVSVPKVASDELLLVNVGSDERPASIEDIADIQKKLAECAVHPSKTLVTHHSINFSVINRHHLVELV
jgi:hypothetical protein